MKILTIENKKEEKFLREKTKNFDFAKSKRKDIQDLIKMMNRFMVDAGGIGLSANQVGMDFRVFIARVNRKFYAIFNPEITKYSKETVNAQEGCLSLPDVLGYVLRPEKVTLEGYDKNGKKIKIKAWGVLARVFQHEVDHLNGKLFIDRIKK